MDDDVEVALLKSEAKSSATPLEEAKDQLEQTHEQLTYERKHPQWQTWDDLLEEEHERDGEREASEPSFRQEWPTAGEARREELPRGPPKQSPFESLRGLRQEEEFSPERKEADSVRIP